LFKLLDDFTVIVEPKLFVLDVLGGDVHDDEVVAFSAIDGR